MADRIVFQMDQTTLAYQNILRNQRKCAECPNLDRRFNLCIGTHHKKRLNLETELYTILQILSVTLFEKVALNELFTTSRQKDIINDSPKQLLLFDL